MSTFRTDLNNNPTAFTTDIAKEAELVLGVDYEQGDSFTVPGPGGVMQTLYTAKLLGDPIQITMRVLDSIGFYTKAGAMRWSYIAIPLTTLLQLTEPQMRDVIGFMYQREGGTAMRPLFPNYGKP
jgi:hypothetical protein